MNLRNAGILCGAFALCFVIALAVVLLKPPDNHPAAQQVPLFDYRGRLNLPTPLDRDAKTVRMELSWLPNPYQHMDYWMTDWDGHDEADSFYGCHLRLYGRFDSDYWYAIDRNYYKTYRAYYYCEDRNLLLVEITAEPYWEPDYRIEYYQPRPPVYTYIRKQPAPRSWRH